MRSRRLFILVGAAADTRRRAAAALVHVPPAQQLWIGDGDVPPGRARRMLGRTLEAVVYAVYDGLSADVLAQVAGLVRAGGIILLRMPRQAAPSEKLAVLPFARAAVGTRLWQRICARFPHHEQPPALHPAAHRPQQSRDQQRVVAQLTSLLTAQAPTLISLTADRGRGKSAALGLAIADLARPVLVSAAHPDAAAEVFRFATGSPKPPRSGAVRFCPPTALLQEHNAGVIVIDEAAQLAVPLLSAIVAANPAAAIAFATTIRGYEGTGRGFVLRFLDQLAQQARPLVRLTLSDPIRWAADDPLEAQLHDALALSAVPAAPLCAGPIRHERLDRDRLADDPQLLEDVFGLLVHAHYRTTPEDLHRILDAPNLTVHALLQAGRVVAASLVAAEGGLSATVCQQVARGEGRIRGHALPDTLISHATQPAAGQRTMIRSVRIATHPARRRQGLASQLVEAIHDHYAPDLFGTMFGATPALLRFRRSLGYRLVRVGAARGSRTGEPTAVMIRPVTPQSAALVATLRTDLARDLPDLVALMRSEGPLDPALVDAFGEGLPAVGPYPPSRRDAIIAGYLHGPAHFEVAAAALREALSGQALSGVSSQEAVLIQLKIREHRSWKAAAAAVGVTVPAAQRALKRALRRRLG